MISLEKIRKEFSLKRFIDSGGFGSVYEFQDKKDRVFAVKFLANPIPKFQQQFFFCKFPNPKKEGIILSKLQKIPGIPKLYYYGESSTTITTADSYMIVTELLGNNLKSEFLKKKSSFASEFIVGIGVKLLDILEAVHRKNIIHRDIKPENILLSKNGIDDFYLVDFGLAKIFKAKENKEYNKFVGSPLFAANDCHHFRNSEKKHDLESLGYVLLYFALGYLPWQDLQSSDFDERVQKMGERKQTFLDKELNTIPSSLRNFFQYLLELKPKCKINYDFLKKLVIELGKELHDSEKKNSWSFLSKQSSAAVSIINSPISTKIFEKQGEIFFYIYYNNKIKKTKY